MSEIGILVILWILDLQLRAGIAIATFALMYKFLKLFKSFLATFSEELKQSE